jgi:hypothetical protein
MGQFFFRDKPVGFREIIDGHKFMKARQRYGFSDGCPLCEQMFEPEATTSVILYVSNRVDIPNSFVHRECVPIGEEDTVFSKIAESWEQAKKYAFWLKR